MTRRQLAAGHVLQVGALCLVLASLLNAPALERTASHLELGSPQRSVAVGIMKPVAAVSSFLLLDRPREAIDDALGREFGEEQLADPAPAPAEPAPVVTVPIPTETTIPLRRSVTELDPLKLWLVADSFGELFGPALVNRAADARTIDAEFDFRFESGLSRPDFFSWPQHIGDRLPEVLPEVAVAIFGGNDGQDVAYQGEILELGTPAWQEVYGLRVGTMMDLLLGEAEHVYWIGMPIMKSDTFTQTVTMMNGIYASEAGSRPEVTFVDIWELFQAENGEFSTYLTDEDGDLIKARSADNAHFYWGGAYRLADHVLPLIAADWNFDL